HDRRRPARLDRRRARRCQDACGLLCRRRGPEFPQLLHGRADMEAGRRSVRPTPVERSPETGFWHPDAPHVFETIDAYLAWGEDRWRNAAGRVGFVTGSGAIGDMQTTLLEALVERAEAARVIPVIFWFDSRDAEGLSKIARPARLD